MDPVEFKCPHCGQSYRMPIDKLAQRAGKFTTCKKCNQAFAFPELPQEMHPAEPQPAAPPAQAPAAAPRPVAPRPAPATTPTPAPAAAADALSDAAAQLAAIHDEPVTSFEEPPAEVHFDAAPQHADVRVPTSPEVHPAPAAAPPVHAHPQPAPHQPPVQQPTYQAPVQPLSYQHSPKSAGGLIEILTFRRMIAIPVIQVLFWVLVISAVIGGLFGLFGGVVMLLQTSQGPGATVGIGMIIAAVVAAVVGVLLSRLFCEVLIVVFRINETVGQIKETLEERR